MRGAWRVMAAVVSVLGCSGGGGGPVEAQAPSRVSSGSAADSSGKKEACGPCRRGAIALAKTVDLPPGRAVGVDASGVGGVRYRFEVHNVGTSGLHDVTLVDRNGPDVSPQLVCRRADGDCELRGFSADSLVACRFPLAAGEGWACHLTTQVLDSPNPFPTSTSVLATDECLQSLRSDVELSTPTVCPTPEPEAALTVDVSTGFPEPLCVPPGGTVSGEIRFRVSNAGGVALEDVLMVDERAISFAGASQFLRLFVCPTGPGTCAFRPASPENVSGCRHRLDVGETFACAIPQQVTSNVLSFADAVTATGSGKDGEPVQASDTQTVHVAFPCTPTPL